MLAQSFSYRRKIKKINKFQFVELNGHLMWCVFGANLVQHFIGRYSRYSRYRTKTHDKSTISHDISHYSRYQTVLLKLEDIITALRQLSKTPIPSRFSGFSFFIKGLFGASPAWHGCARKKLFTNSTFYDIIYLVRYLIDRLEFGKVN